ncbi:vipA [Symbiodinium microadriaticum]|nr:vipA [Symbiodinium microadriaticum]
MAEQKVARIYQPTKNAMQSGQRNSKVWVLEYEPKAAKTIDPLMGWTGTQDMNRQVKLKFPTKDAAIAYAEKHGLAFKLREPRTDLLKSAWLALCLGLVASAAHGDTVEKPLWELSVGAFGTYGPDYPASDEYHWNGIGSPLAVYRGDWLRVGDGSLVSAIAADTPAFTLDISADGAFSADSEDNNARQGMPDLDFLGEVGPKLVLHLLVGRFDNGARLTFDFELPVRAVFSTDLRSVEHVGFVVHPELDWEFDAPGDGFDWDVEISAQWVDEDMAALFYEVEPRFVRPDRPAFQAEGGYLGSSFKVGVNKPLFGDFELTLSGRVESFHGKKVAVVGLGYVGLPLAIAFGKIRETVGFDPKRDRIRDVKQGIDETREVDAADFAKAAHLSFTADASDIADCEIYIVAVPTPVDETRKPDLSALMSASATVGAVLKPGDIVIYESTVYPGATEEECVPVLEETSGLKFNQGFFVGYSPERINPGDKDRRLEHIVKVTSGSTPAVADEVDALYAQVVSAGTHKAPSIKIAEAAKVIENTQRDLNIALINELAQIFGEMGIDTQAVLEAAGTKWNFLPFRPGLVGGHCIGVDPYYLTYKAEQIGHDPNVILAGRAVNDSMGTFVATRFVKAMTQKSIALDGARVLVMGLAFKENCPDIRNTKVIDVVSELQDFGLIVDVHDPWVLPGEAGEEYGLSVIDAPQAGQYDGVILAVAHDQFKMMGASAIRALGKPNHVLYDLKYVLPAGDSDLRL